MPEDLVDAARAQGLTEWQILTRLEIPLAANMMLGGLRSPLRAGSSRPATIVAYLSGGTLGRYLSTGSPCATTAYARRQPLLSDFAFAVDAHGSWCSALPAGLTTNWKKA